MDGSDGSLGKGAQIAAGVVAGRGEDREDLGAVAGGQQAREVHVTAAFPRHEVKVPVLDVHDRITMSIKKTHHAILSPLIR